MSKPIIGHHESSPGSIKSYLAGFSLSLILTVVAYWMVAEKITSGWSLIYSLAGLAVAQLFVQLIFFLHLGRESRPYWNLQALLFAVGVVVILVFGSLWIMQNLMYDHAVMPSETELIKDEGYQP